MRLTPSIKTLITNIVARDIAAGVELARSLGHKMPKDFDVGVSFLEDGDGRTRIRMRLNDACYDAIVTLPHLDGQLSLQRVDAMWKAAWERIHADTLVVAQVWLDKHPDAFTKESVTALAIVDAVLADDVLQKRWLASCAERAKHFTYTAEPGARLTDV